MFVIQKGAALQTNLARAFLLSESKRFAGLCEPKANVEIALRELRLAHLADR